MVYVERPQYVPRPRPRRVHPHDYYKRSVPDYRDERPYEEGCRNVYKGVGNQHLTVDGAKQAADEVWAGTVRFHIGEKFMDLSNARRVTYTCSRSSIKEAGLSTLGQTLTRCEIEANPCAASRERK